MVMEVVMLKMEAEEVTGMEDDRSDKNMGGNIKTFVSRYSIKLDLKQKFASGEIWYSLSCLYF